MSLPDVARLIDAARGLDAAELDVLIADLQAIAATRYATASPLHVEHESNGRLEVYEVGGPV